MKEISSLRFKFALALLLVPVLFFLPSCWLKDKMCGTKSMDSSAVLVSMKGSPVITMHSFEKEFEQLLEENPHLKSVLSIMPDAKKNFLMGMVNQEVVDRWVSENHVDESDDYKKELDRMMRSVRRMLNTKHFGLKHPVQVTEAELTDFYEKNKDSMPDLMVSRGGVHACGVSFDKESDAKAFLAKARESKDLKRAADAAKVSKHYKDFKLVNAQSLGMDAALRDRIVAMEKCPSTEMVKVSDKSFWVVSTSNKQESQYRPFEQVKAGLEQFVAKERRMAMFDQEIGKLRTEYTVVINEEHLKPAAPETQVADANVQNPAQPEAQVAHAEQAPEAAQKSAEVAAAPAAPSTPAEGAKAV